MNSFANSSFDGYFRQSTTTPQELFNRTQAVLNYYGVPSEEDPSLYISDYNNMQSITGVQKILPYMDPHKIFGRLASITKSDLDVFQDIDSKQIPDFQVSLKTSDEEPNYEIGDASVRTIQRPLNGLKIAIDPGHMGGSFWDRITGKYVRDSQGHTISEGVIALQTALLLRADLQNLGATVLLTRESLKPVTNLDYDTFDLLPFAQIELRENTHMPWFRRLLTLAPPGPTLFHAFDQSRDVRKIFSENMRGYYFVFRADLAARADMINEFKPDLVLVIHYDTAVTDSHPNGLNANAPNATKAFVMGAYESNEFASRDDRKYFVSHLLDVKSWTLSLNLSRKIVQKMHDTLNLNLSNSVNDGTVKVEPGIFSRNLGVTRRLKAPAVSYLECLFYNRPQEFHALINAKHPMLIDGENIPYSDRLYQVSEAIRDGVLDFFKNNP